ncbi:hypothetical protein [Ruminococcus albus]|uniref:Uncharacterized protein n=1 Tax=Ruminococcus albus (strain ATCC 27210 / DSM 20455 / JCM 14654 / NCDO 2250 / 7) TaxID=697329 RepID=E6UJU0_RUMA7|nr:hypothetical protein [Ruminococcus albus]ADU23936.1 hypothetical protein Rumal_3489 [Ruminococcus albus 7 = DSM 20455]
MGQRSQMYIKFESEKEKILIANYYQWNYGERMISRAKYVIEYIKNAYDTFYKEGNFHFWYENKDTIRKLKRLLDVNFDMQDIVLSQDIIEEFKEEADDNCKFNDYVFYGQDNNDGQFYLYVMNNGSLKYTFTDYNCNDRLTAHQYMEDYNAEDREICEENTTYIEENAQLLSNSEWAEFLDDNYSSLYKRRSTPAEEAVFKLSMLWGDYLRSKKSYKGILYSDFLSKIPDDKAANIIRNKSRWCNESSDINKLFQEMAEELIDESFEIDILKEVELCDVCKPSIEPLKFASGLTSKTPAEQLILYNKLLKKTSSSANRKIITDTSECAVLFSIDSRGNPLITLKLYGEKFGKLKGKPEMVELTPFERYELYDLANEYCKNHYSMSLPSRC